MDAKTGALLLELALPFPPSVNAMYSGNRITNRRFKSQEYSKWIEECRRIRGSSAWSVPKSSNAFHVETFFYTKIFTKAGVLRIFDIDNYKKALFDFMAGGRDQIKNPPAVANFKDHMVVSCYDAKMQSDKDPHVIIRIFDVVFKK